jgi:hypothetical protein
MIEGAELVKLRPEHTAIAPYLRRADLEEVFASWGGMNCGVDPALAVGFSIACSAPGWAVELNGSPVAVFGVRPVGGRKGMPWLLATDEIERHPVHFYRISKGIIQEMRGRYGFLENWVHEENRLSTRWLAWAGFTIEPPEGRRPFRRFWWSKGEDQSCVRP